MPGVPLNLKFGRIKDIWVLFLCGDLDSITSNFQVVLGFESFLGGEAGRSPQLCPGSVWRCLGGLGFLHPSTGFV